jgi:hypothetical protein
MKQNLTLRKRKQLEANDARYRFLRSEQSRDHKFHKQSCLKVGLVDWGKRLGASGASGAFWSVRDISENEMDKVVVKLMKREQRQ